MQAVPDGLAALESARLQLPDLVLTDVMIPRLDGFGLIKALRADERTRRLPVILLSARAGEEAAAEGLEAGADDYLIKPFSARDLIVRVRTHIERAKTRGERLEAVEWRATELPAANKEKDVLLEDIHHCVAAVEESSVRNKKLLLIDELTMLHNRRGFLVLGESFLKFLGRDQQQKILFFFDLDNLRDINDQFGHAAGDDAICAMASTLKDTFRDSDLIARLGGDEFVVLASMRAGEVEAESARARAAEDVKRDRQSPLCA